MQSFFGNAKPPVRPAQVSTVTVKKKVVVRPGSSPVARLHKANSSSLPSSNGSPLRPTSRDSGHTPRPKLKHASSSSTPSGTASPRRRKVSPQRVLPPSDSESSDNDAVTPKRRRVGPTATASTATPDLSGETVGRTVFCPLLCDERGEWGRGYAGFVTCEEAVRSVVSGWAGGNREKEVGAREKYLAYFPQVGFENAEPVPTVELQYPSGAREKFVLLTPTSPREYNPMSELRNALRFILKHYVPPSHAHIFGSLEAGGDMESTGPSRMQTPGVDTPDGSPAPSMPHETIGDALRRALAPNRRDGPGLLKAVARLNAALADIKQDGTMAQWLLSDESRMSKLEWSALVDFVNDQAYSRVIAPFSDQLEHHPKHPDEVAAAISEKEDAYGELRHNFMSRIIDQTGLGPDSVFVDLGSGVGNCVVQAALQTGCTAYGFELLPVPARCARLQLRESQRRWAMWCLNGNINDEVHEGDFRYHPEVGRRLSQADVVLVNNEVFPSSLNIELTNMFLDLKDGAVIVSLKPFVHEGFRMNETNCDSFAAILRSTSHPYYADWVSWKADSGRYFVQVVDRTMRLKYEEERKRRR